MVSPPPSDRLTRSEAVSSSVLVSADTPAKTAKIQFVDQTPELENFYAIDDSETAVATPEPPSGNTNESERRNDLLKPHVSRSQDLTSTSIPRSVPMPESVGSIKALSPSPLQRDAATSEPAQKRRRINGSAGTPPLSSPFPTGSPYHSPLPPDLIRPLALDMILPDPGESPHFGTPTHLNQAVEAEYRRLADTAAAAIPSVSSGLLSPEVWKKRFFWPNSFTTVQCACLMRYYVEELAPWFDVCDPIRHFTTIVPQRARRCPPLLNAIFTAAARHLARLSKYKTADGIIKYHGVTLRDLTDETAIRYHNACIAYLIELSTHEEHVKDENLLAAAVILRYYEELDASLTGEDAETFLHTFQVFTNAQASTAFSPMGRGSQSGFSGMWESDVQSSARAYAKSFRHASFRIALRQETTSAFMKQRSIMLPLEAWSALRSFDEAEDDVWTDRLIVFCADVLQFCFGDESVLGRSRIERWRELKEFESLWEVAKPPSFGAIHYQEASKSTGEVFPQIWYLAECHIAGMQYLDLARILLAVYDPTIPRLGPGAAAAIRRVSQEVQKIVLRLCGIAVSNRASQPALVMASMAIAICGEHISDRDQQKRMLGLIQELEESYGWPTSKTVETLQHAWSSGIGEERSAQDLERDLQALR